MCQYNDSTKKYTRSIDQIKELLAITKDNLYDADMVQKINNSNSDEDSDENEMQYIIPIPQKKQPVVNILNNLSLYP